MTYKNNENHIERILRFVIALVVVMSLAIPVISPGVFAASAVNISGGDNVNGGDTFNVVVTFSGGDVGRVDAQMTYDTEQLSYISGGTSKGNTGYIQLKNAGTEGTIVFNIKFQAISDGSASVKVTTNEMYNFDEMPMDKPSASKTINIEGNALEEELITEPADEEVPVEETTLVGVDEISSESEEITESDEGINIVRLVIISAIVIVILIVIITVIIGKSSKKRRRAKRRR